MQFTLTGFTQNEGCRIFAYEGTSQDRVRTRYTVRADLSLSRKYGIRLQELPLMCLEILVRNSEDNDGTASPVRALTFTEEAMNRYAEECVAVREAAALKRSSTRRQPAKEPAAEGFDTYSGNTPVPAKSYGQSW